MIGHSHASLPARACLAGAGAVTHLACYACCTAAACHKTARDCDARSCHMLWLLQPGRRHLRMRPLPRLGRRRQEGLPRRALVSAPGCRRPEGARTAAALRLCAALRSRYGGRQPLQLGTSGCCGRRGGGAVMPPAGAASAASHSSAVPGVCSPARWCSAARGRKAEQRAGYRRIAGYRSASYVRSTCERSGGMQSMYGYMYGLAGSHQSAGGVKGERF